MQIDRPERGFSYATDAPLDMRMDPASELSARELVNEAGERELTRIFRDYGEERYARPIARAIVRRRREQPFERTGELVETIKSAIPAPARFGDGHPAKRVFQALRIAVNDELGSLEAALPAALEMLRPGGRLAVISFHSLEDRIVKRFLRSREKRLHVPARLPGLRLRPRAGAARALAPADQADAGRARCEPARLVGSPAGGGQDRRRGVAPWPPGATPHPRFRSPRPRSPAAAEACAEAQAAGAPRRGRRRRLDRGRRGPAGRRRRDERRRPAAERPARQARHRSARTSAPRSRSSPRSSRWPRPRRASSCRPRSVGLVPADPAETTYVRLGPRTR